MCPPSFENSLIRVGISQICRESRESPRENGKASPKGRLPSRWFSIVSHVNNSFPWKVCPGTDFSHEVGGRINRETWRKGNTSASTSAHALNPTSSTYSSANSPLGDLVPSEDEDVVTLKLSESLKTMDLNGWRSRFIGKSSGVTLVKKAIDLKKEVTGSGEHQARIQFHRVQDEPYYPVRSYDPGHNAYVLIAVSSGNARPESLRSPNSSSLTKNWA